jgi:hypothetical protein
MNDPIRTARLAEIREADRRDYADGQIIRRRPRSAIAQRRELLAEVDRLTAELADVELRAMAEPDGLLRAIARSTEERDEARAFARRFRAMTLDGFDNPTSAARQLGLRLDDLPPWFATPPLGAAAPTTASDDVASVDDLPGMWDQSDLTGGETDAVAQDRAADPTAAGDPA